MKKHLSILVFILSPLLVFSQNVGVGTPDPLMTMHVKSEGDTVLLLENLNPLNQGVQTSMYFKTGNGNFPYTGAIKTIGTTGSAARLGFYTYAANKPNGLIERMSILDGGNVGIGTIFPDAKLHVTGNVKVAGTISGVSDPVAAQDAATKAYVDALEAQVAVMNTILLDAGYNGTVSDVDGNVYKTITIGTQTWMAENLKTTRYNDGTAISLITDDAAWEIAGTDGTPAYCWYDNDASNLITYGALYNWYAIDISSNDNKNVCPVGWHVPTDGEWYILRDHLDPAAFGNDNIAGGKMKEAGTQYWLSPNTGATNDSGFSGFPGGYRDVDGTFDGIGSDGYWWSSTESGTSNAWNRYLTYVNVKVSSYSDDKRLGFSVRCLRDD